MDYASLVMKESSHTWHSLSFPSLADDMGHEVVKAIVEIENAIRPCLREAIVIGGVEKM